MSLPEKKIIAIITISAVSLSLAFYAGMEYQSYRIGKKISEAFSSSFWNTSGSNESKKSVSLFTKEESKKEYTIVPAWTTHTMSGSKDSTVSVSLGDISVWKKEIVDGYSTYTAKNSYTTIDINVENTGKTPTWLYIGNVKLILSDWTTYEAESSNQIKWCVGCSMNPGSKETESILFDANISEDQLVWAKLEVSNVHFIVK